MATPLKKPVTRVTLGALDGCFGPDRGRRIKITLIPGNGSTTPDVIELTPAGTRRAERIAAIDVYRLAMVRRVNCERLEKARKKKERIAERRKREAIARADRRMFKNQPRAPFEFENAELGEEG